MKKLLYVIPVVTHGKLRRRRTMSQLKQCGWDYLYPYGPTRVGLVFEKETDGELSEWEKLVLQNVSQSFEMKDRL